MDACFLSPPFNAPVLLSAFTASRAKELAVLSGGVQAADPCDRGFHEFQGLDRELADAMIGFIDRRNALLAGGTLLPRHELRNRRILYAFRSARLGHYLMFFVLRSPALLGIAVLGRTALFIGVMVLTGRQVWPAPRAAGS